MLAVYELVRFLLANKRQTVRCDCMVGCSNHHDGRMDGCISSCVDYIDYTSPFYLCIIHDCTQTVFGRLRFRLQAFKQITAAATSSSSAESAISAVQFVVQQNVVVCDTNVGQQMLTNTVVGQHLLVVCLRLYAHKVHAGSSRGPSCVIYRVGQLK